MVLDCSPFVICNVELLFLVDSHSDSCFTKSLSLQSIKIVFVYVIHVFALSIDNLISKNLSSPFQRIALLCLIDLGGQRTYFSCVLLLCYRVHWELGDTQRRLTGLISKPLHLVSEWCIRLFNDFSRWKTSCITRFCHTSGLCLTGTCIPTGDLTFTVLMGLRKCTARRFIF